MDTDYIKNLRINYTKSEMNEADLGPNPIAVLQDWFNLALADEPSEPNAFCLSTSDEFGRPHSRTVLLKEITSLGIVFYTNYLSSKGKQIFKNPRVAGNFYWPSLERQIRIEGIASQISREKSVAYFNTRPKESKAGAIVSNQSNKIESRKDLELAMEELLNLDEAKLQCPENWGGFEIAISYIEFWQGRSGRLHDRIVFDLNEKGQWEKYRLAP